MPHHPELRVLLVDDEPLALERMRDLLAEVEGVRVIGAVEEGRRAVDEIREADPDLVLLDIQMSDLDGFGVIERVGVTEMPPVIFVTAFDEFAIRAFDLAAADYLLKPVSLERLRTAVERVRARIRADLRSDEEGLIRRLLDAVSGLPRSAAAPPRRILVPDGEGHKVLSTDQIYQVRGAGNYVRVHTRDGEYLVRDSLASLEEQLDPAVFVRVHRSVVLNVQTIDRLAPWFSGDLIAHLRNGEKVKISRTYREQFERVFGPL